MARAGRAVATVEGRVLSLYDHLRRLPGCRAARGIRYSVATLLAIAIMAKMAGCRGITAASEFAAKRNQDTLRDLYAVYSHRLGRFTAPSVNTFRGFLMRLPAGVLNQALHD